VTVEGTVVDRTSARIALSNDGEILVRLPARLQDRAAYEVGATVRATGILKPGSNGSPELVPRDGADLSLLAPAPLPKDERRPEPPLSPASAGMTGAAGGVLLSAGWTMSAGARRRIADFALRIAGRTPA
jgi:hypothetical protein